MKSRSDSAPASRIPVDSDLHEHGRRVDGLDAARGVAMFFVCVSHFVLNASAGWVGGRPDPMLWSVFLSTPTFFMASGVALGFVMKEPGAPLGGWPLSRRLDRAVYLIVAVHILLALSEVARTGAFGQMAHWSAYRFVAVTDILGVSLLVNAWIVEITEGGERLLLAGTVYVISLLINYNCIPHGYTLTAIRDAFFGARAVNHHILIPGFPLLPWLSVHLACTVLGETIANERSATGTFKRTRGFVVAGLAFVALAIALKLGDWYAKGHAWLASSSALAGEIYQVTSPVAKFPPSPAYLSFYGGVAIGLFGLLLAEPRRKLWGKTVAGLAMLGRVDLFVWIAQAFVYGVGIYVLQPPVVLWPIYFIATVLLIGLAANVWDRRDLNRYLSFYFIPGVFKSASLVSRRRVNPRAGG